MRLNEIPVSRSEAWKLYNEGKNIIEYQGSLKGLGTVLEPKAHTFDKFQEKGKIWTVQLSEEDTMLFVNNAKWRMAKVVYALYAIGAGIILFGFFINPVEKMRFSVTECLIYSQILIGTGSHCIISAYESMKNEEKLWNSMYEKYKTFAWRDS